MKKTYGLLLALASLLKLSGLNTVGLGKYFGSLWMPALQKHGWSNTQRAKFPKKFHKPPLGVNIINFELNWFNASIRVPWNVSESATLNSPVTFSSSYIVLPKHTPCK